MRPLYPLFPTLLLPKKRYLSFFGCAHSCVCVCVRVCVQGWSKPDVVRNVALPLEGKGGDCALTPSAGASPRLSCEELRSRGQEAWAPSCFKPGQVT